MSDDDMEIMLHNLARKTGIQELREIADRLAELAGKERRYGHVQ